MPSDKLYWFIEFGGCRDRTCSCVAQQHHPHYICSQVSLKWTLQCALWPLKIFPSTNALFGTSHLTLSVNKNIFQIDHYSLSIYVLCTAFNVCGSLNWIKHSVHHILLYYIMCMYYSLCSTSIERGSCSDLAQRSQDILHAVSSHPYIVGSCPWPQCDSASG